MKFPYKPLWKIAHGHFVSTTIIRDRGLETMVFPASENAGIRWDFWGEQVVGVDTEHPLEEYTRHYATAEEAKRGHYEVCRAIRDRFGPTEEEKKRAADERLRERKQKRAEAGLCVKCGTVPATPGYKTCLRCRKRQQQHNNEWYRRKCIRQIEKERNDQTNG